MGFFLDQNQSEFSFSLLTDIDFSGGCDDERSTSGLLRNAIVVALPKKVLTVLDPSVSNNRKKKDIIRQISFF